MSLLWQAIVLFAVTNIDDLVVLSLFFSRANRAPGSSRRIVAGQYFGFAAILAVSIAGALGAAQLPDDATAYLGLVPIAIGLYAARPATGNTATTPTPTPRPPRSTHGASQASLSPTAETTSASMYPPSPPTPPPS